MIKVMMMMMMIVSLHTATRETKLMARQTHHTARDLESGYRFGCCKQRNAW